MDDQILKRVNSRIKARKERTEAFGNKIRLIADQPLISCDDRFSAGRLFFLTILNTLKQHTLQNLIIHCALGFTKLEILFILSIITDESGFLLLPNPVGGISTACLLSTCT
jgi:hypothetical protein